MSQGLRYSMGLGCSRKPDGVDEDSQALSIKKRAQVFLRICPNQCLGDS